MRVMMLSWEYPPRIVGGISPHVYDLSKELVKRGIEVHVVTKATPQAPDEEIEPSGVHVHRVHLEHEPNDFMHEIQLLNQAIDKRVRRLLEDWREEGQPTIFHAHDWLSLDAARELKYEYQLPMVATVHAVEHGRHGGIFSDISKAIHEQEYWLTYEAWRVIVCSDFMKNEVHNLFQCPMDKIDVIYNGVDPSKFEFEWSEQDRLAQKAQIALPHEKIVVYVGRFVREKGIQVLLNSAHIILAQEPDAKFVIIGGGATKEHFEKFVRWAGLEDKVHFTGFMKNRALHQLYRVADVAVFPSLYEPFGIVALEAMAAGTPVVASDAGGLSEVVKHDLTGTRCYSNDAASLAWAVLRVLQDPSRSQNLVQNAKLRLKVEFDWGLLAEKTARVYDQVWAEFLGSYWADKTLWPVTPGASERAERLQVRDKAVTGGFVARPRPQTSIPMPIPRDLLPDEEMDELPDETADIKL